MKMKHMKIIFHQKNHCLFMKIFVTDKIMINERYLDRFYASQDIFIKKVINAIYEDINLTFIII